MSEQCAKTVYPSGASRGHQCTRKAVKNGLCKQHIIQTRLARGKAREARWEKKQENSVFARLEKERNSLLARIEELEKECSTLEKECSILREENWKLILLQYIDH